MQTGNLKTASGERDIDVCSIALLKHFMYGVNTNLRKQPTFHYLNTGFPAERTEKFHTDDVSPPRYEQCFWLVKANFPPSTTSQKYYPDLGSDTSPVWNFSVLSSDIFIAWGNQFWRREMSAVFLRLRKNLSHKIQRLVIFQWHREFSVAVSPNFSFLLCILYHKL